MTPELIGIITVGIALAALMFTMINRVERRLDRVEQCFEEHFERLEDRMSSLEKRQARLEGLLDGIRESLFERSRTQASGG